MNFSESDLDFDKIALKQIAKISERDPQHFAKVTEIVEDICKNGYGGGFHPEMLRGNLSGWCSKEVDKKNRVVFKIKDGRVHIAQVMGHYDDH
jgi:toxin YoeB